MQGAPQGGGDGASAADLRKLVEAHQPADRREAASKATFLAELDRLERPWDEHADRVHATGSSVIVGARGTVLHLHRRLRRWLQPGGHIDEGESPAAAALRESREETGLSLTHPPGGEELIHVDVHEAANDHVHLDLRFLLLAADEDPAPGPGESPEVRWYGWDEAEAIADESLIGALRAARARAQELGAAQGVDRGEL